MNIPISPGRAGWTLCASYAVAAREIRSDYERKTLLQNSPSPFFRGVRITNVMYTSSRCSLAVVPLRRALVLFKAMENSENSMIDIKRYDVHNEKIVLDSAQDHLHGTVLCAPALEVRPSTTLRGFTLRFDWPQHCTLTWKIAAPGREIGGSLTFKL